MTSHLDFQILLLEELVIALNTHRPTFSRNLNFVDAAFRPKTEKWRGKTNSRKDFSRERLSVTESQVVQTK
jgi:hypothetical protein